MSCRSSRLPGKIFFSASKCINMFWSGIAFPLCPLRSIYRPKWLFHVCIDIYLACQYFWHWFNIRFMFLLKEIILSRICTTATPFSAPNTWHSWPKLGRSFSTCPTPTHSKWLFLPVYQPYQLYYLNEFYFASLGDEWNNYWLQFDLLWNISDWTYQV